MANIRVLNEKDYSQSTWSGGKTTQICLFPPQGRYEIGQFDFRLSSATVLLEESVFSSLPGYQRIIMSLDQTLTLTHKTRSGSDSRTVKLAPFETDYFDGDDETTSIGQCQDFNLIYTEQYEGAMQAIKLGEKRPVSANQFYCLYFLTDGEVVISGLGDSKVISCKKSNTLIIESREKESGYVIMKRQFPFCAPIAVEVTVKQVGDEHLVKGD